MSLLPRLAKGSFAVVVLVSLTSLPVGPASRTPGSALAPRLAWAGGSPDETLKPPTTPPDPTKKAASIRTTTGTGGSARLETSQATALRRLTLRERFELAYRILRIYALRY
jgi:hypothetical protein